MAQIGDEATEQFEIVVSVDGKEIKRQPLHDPFVCSTTVVGISRWDHFLAIFRQRRIRVVVRVSGSHSAQARIMTMDPAEMMRENENWLKACAESRANSMTNGWGAAEEVKR